MIQKFSTPTLRVTLSIILLILILSLPPASNYDSYLDIISHTSMTLKGLAPYSDVAQDFYGFRALITNQDPYVILRIALKTMGIEWKANFSSTHPPTSFLVVAPVALLPWPISSMAWAWLMLFCLYFSLWRGFEFSWDTAVLLTVISLLWPPISTSFDQITIVWLFGLAMAYKYRNTHPFISGLFIGLASFTKLLPIVLLFPFALRGKWKAIIGFATIWFTALGILVLLSPKTMLRYFITNRTNAVDILMRQDNGAFLFFLERRLGVLGAVITAMVLLALLFLVLRNFHKNTGYDIPKEEWDIIALVSIIVLPITWIFSIAPLLPNLLQLFRDKRFLIQILALSAFIPPLILPPWGIKSTLGLFGFFIFSGMAFTLSLLESHQSGKTMDRSSQSSFSDITQ